MFEDFLEDGRDDGVCRTGQGGSDLGLLHERAVWTLTSSVVRPNLQHDVHQLARQRTIQCRLIDAEDGAEGFEDKSEDFVTSLQDEGHEV